MKIHRTVAVTVVSVTVLFAAFAVYAATSFVGEGTVLFDSIRVGQQGVGGVTYFNGTILNNTTDAGAAVPVTFGDDVRIDGRIWLGETQGTTDAATPFIIDDNAEVTGDLTIGSLTGAGVVGTDELADGSVATADIANGAVTTGKLADGSVAAADIANDAVTPAKIEGTGGANLPIAYGYCNSNGTTYGGTTNVSCSWNAGSSFYEVTISDVDYYYKDFVTVVTPITGGLIADVGSVSNNLVVAFTTHGGAAGQQTDFSFVTYAL